LVFVKREVEIEPRLFAIGDHIETGGDLVVDRCDDGVLQTTSTPKESTNKAELKET
jgi:hypothetical protein